MKKIILISFILLITIINGANDNKIKIYNITNNKLENIINLETDDCYDVKYLENNEIIILDGNKVYTYTLNNNYKLLNEFKNEYYNSIIVMKNKEIIIGSMHQIVKLEKSKKILLQDGDGQLLAYNSLEEKMVSTGMDRKIVLWDLKTKKKIKTIENSSGTILDMCFSLDGKYFVYSDRGGNVYIRDSNTLKIIKKFDNGYYNNSVSIAISPNNKYIAIGQADKLIKVIEISSGRIIKELKGHTSVIYSLAFSRDGKKILSASGRCEELNLNDDKIKLWDISSGKVIMEIKENKEAAYRATFSPDESKIVIWNGGERAVEEFGD